jgi:hypothetical protein
MPKGKIVPSLRYKKTIVQNGFIILHSLQNVEENLIRKSVDGNRSRGNYIISVPHSEYVEYLATPTGALIQIQAIAWLEVAFFGN